MNTLADHPMQSVEWGEARKKLGTRVEKIVDNEHVFQFTIHPIPYSPFSIGYLPRSTVPSESVLKQLYEFGKKNNLLFIKMEPYVSYEDGNRLETANSQICKSPHSLFPEWTQTLDLTKTEDELLKNMKSKTRYNIRLAEKKGVIIKELSNSEGYSIFEKLYFETCKRQHYHGHSPAYHQTIWNSVKDSQGHILVAFLGDVPLAAYELLLFKKRFYYLYGGSSTLHKNVMAPNLLMWEAIKLGKKLGAETFDMWGSLPPTYSESHPWAGFTRFKEGYGTQFTHLSAGFDLVINPILYPIYNLIYSIREKILTTA
ncbi:MAG: peptidoglycan bridge formation glycyltransferase FemA/FemB family protein [Candidatus Roizmanbacteria bacterium]|nr:peptidoglycan bridge formation glycyltransferase FemA/FemB family protein [Candidatus Roizmanbacteria bacterium]